MPVAVAAPAVGESAQMINGLLNLGRFVGSDEEAFVALMDSISRLEKADPADAAVQRAWAYHLTGDVDRALAELESPHLLHHSSMKSIHRLMLLTNLVESGKLFREYAKLGAPETGNFSQLFPAGIVSGSFSKVAQFSARANGMKIKNVEGLPVQEITAAAAILAKNGVTDDAVSGLLSIAGELIREQGVFYNDTAPTVHPFQDESDDGGSVYVRFRLPISPTKATELGLMFVERVDERGLNLPDCLHIGFSGTSKICH